MGLPALEGGGVSLEAQLAAALETWAASRSGVVRDPPTTETRTDRASVRRFEAGRSGDLSWRLDASSVLEHPNGWIDVTGVATRAGVFLYAEQDGSERRELRPESEVFDGRSMASLVGVPFTNNHPSVALDSQNTQQHQVGTVLAVARRDDLLEARIRITSDRVVQDVAEGKVELSGGYSTEVLDEPGTTPDGETFDAVQTQIRYNHLALVDEARAGPVARLRLDRGDAAQPRPSMKTTIKIRNVEHQVDTAKLNAILAKASAPGLRVDALETEAVSIGGADLVLPMSMVEGMLAALTGGTPQVATPAEPEPEPEPAAPADDLGAALDAEGTPPIPARANSADSRLEALEKRIDAMPANVRQQMADRGRIERVAAQVLPSNFRYDTATDVEIMGAAIVAANPDLQARVDAAKGNADYLRGIFETVVETATRERMDSHDILASMTRQDGPAPTPGLTPPPDNVTRIDAARTRYYDRLHGRTTDEGAA